MISALGAGPAAEYEADVAIIGSGAMAMTMAADFMGGTLKVLILEAGGRRASNASQALYDAEIAGHPFTGAQTGRARVYGGSTTTWGGQFLPLSGIVFDDRPWLNASGWPLAKASLADGYARAEAVGQLAARPGDPGLWTERGVAAPALDPALAAAEFSKWSPRPNLGENLAGRIEASDVVDVLVDAAVTDIRLNSDGTRIDHLVIRAMDGTEGRVRARAYVLAAGGIESPRILLSADSQDSRGVGNRSGNVGRYYQDHVSVPAAVIEPRRREDLHRLFEQQLVGATKYAPKLVMSEALQRNEGLLNVGGIVKLPQSDAGVGAAKALVQGLRRGRLPAGAGSLAGAALAGLPGVAALAWDYKVGQRIRAPRAGPVTLELHVEQRPLAESRIRLSEARDAMGMRKAVVDWRFDEASRRAARRFTEVLADEFSRLGLGEIRPNAAVLDNDQGFWNGVTDMYHHMGALRMSTDPAEGVVDAECRSHEVENLYAAGCSVFPVSGYSNPTHTAMALAIGLGERLRAELG